MTHDSGINWEDAFKNADYIDDSKSYPDNWANRAAAFRDSCQHSKIDLSYGSHAREKLDLFYPKGTPKGLVMFVHGGFWMAFDKSYWSFLAKGAIERGYAVALPSYTLAPEAGLPQMTQQIGQALKTASDMVEGPIYTVGHSAGGHLVTRLICADTPLSAQTIARIKRVISISGLHDLRPLRLHSMNETLGLDAQTAALESAILHRPTGSAHLIAWVGANERPEFLRQASLLHEAWRETSAKTQLVVEPAYHHFDVINGLENPSSRIMTALLGDSQ